MCFGVTWSLAADASVDVLGTLSDSLIIAVGYSCNIFRRNYGVPPLRDFSHVTTLSADVFISSSLTASTAVFIPPYASMGDT